MKIRKFKIRGISQLNRLERFTEEICDQYNVPADYFGNILLATSESGRVLLMIHKDTVNGVIEMLPERIGKTLVFNFRFVPGIPKNPETIDYLDIDIRKQGMQKEMFIINALADQMKMSPDGTEMVLKFSISSIHYEKSLQRVNMLQEYWCRTAETVKKRDG